MLSCKTAAEGIAALKGLVGKLEGDLAEAKSEREELKSRLERLEQERGEERVERE